MTSNTVSKYKLKDNYVSKVFLQKEWGKYK